MTEETKPTPPDLNEDALRAALDKAIDYRRRQAAFKKELKEGKHPDIVLTLAKCLEDDALARLRVRVFMESLPGIGKVSARKLMDELKIADSRRIQGLGRQQRADIETRVRLIAGMR